MGSLLVALLSSGLTSGDSTLHGIHFWWPILQGTHFWWPFSLRDSLLVTRRFMGPTSGGLFLYGSTSGGPPYTSYISGHSMSQDICLSSYHCNLPVRGFSFDFS